MLEDGSALIHRPITDRHILPIHGSFHSFIWLVYVFSGIDNILDQQLNFFLWPIFCAKIRLVKQNLCNPMTMFKKKHNLWFTVFDNLKKKRNRWHVCNSGKALRQERIPAKAIEAEKHALLKPFHELLNCVRNKEQSSPTRFKRCRHCYNL